MDKNNGLNLQLNVLNKGKGNIMASNTMQTRCRRKLRRKKAGKARKNMLDNKGSTPKFAIHKEK